MEGVVLKIDEARGMLPRHPNCRCALVPANVGEETDDQKRSKTSIQSAVRVSARLGRDGFDTAIPVSKERPVSVLKNNVDRFSRLVSQLHGGLS